MGKKRLRLKKKTKYGIVMIICIIGMVYSGINIIIWAKSVNDNAKIQIEIKDYIKIESDNEDYYVDFESLKQKNPDTIAYLRVNNTNIDYVVVKTDNNEYYLNHNFNKENNVAGWIFANYLNKFDESDKNIVIFGHNTKDGSMFGTLKNILNKNWYENNDNRKILLITEKDVYFYEIFSCYSIVPEDFYIKANFKDDNDFLDFINILKKRSIYDFNIDVGVNDNILTLSSCMQQGKKRVVLHARLIK